MAFLSIAKVFHKRLSPRVNQFSYDVFYLGFDIAKISQIRRALLGVDSFNIFSFYSKDHGGRDCGKGSGPLRGQTPKHSSENNIEQWIRQILDEKNLNQKVKNIFLVTHPRLFGYVFNPVSFWFCLDENKNLIAVLCEVNNTFGEHHDYLIFNHNHAPIEENQEFEAQKDFHVSPFFTREGKYKFRFKFSSKNIFVAINYFSNDDQPLLLTTVSCKNIALNNRNLLKLFFAIPFVTFKVLALIHFQALKIIFKKIKYIKKPQQKTHKITFNAK